MEVQGIVHDGLSALPVLADGSAAGSAAAQLPAAGSVLQEGGWLRGNCVALVTGTVQLLVPQHDVLHTGYLQTGEAVAGALVVSEELLLLPAVPQDCFVYTAFADAPAVNWCWNDVRVLIDLHVQLHPLPNVVLAPHTPLTAVVTLPDGSHAFYTRAAQLSRFVRQQAG